MIRPAMHLLTAEASLAARATTEEILDKIPD
jgi:hypothetical protein